ncbi:Hypothetical protein PROPJV5_2563, partial [Propionibacterium ruminifibrarum]
STKTGQWIKYTLYDMSPNATNGRHDNNR